MKKMILFLIIIFSFGIVKDNKAQPSNVVYDTIAVNRIIDWVSSNGYDSFDPRTGGSGFYWYEPNSFSMQAVFSEGLLWGGYVSNDLRVGGVFYNSQSYSPLLIDSASGKYSKIWKIRKDWESFPEGDFKDRLRNDYENWPVEFGAPWEDVNNDGQFTSGVDKPKFLGDEVLYMVYSNSDTVNSINYFGTLPVNLEIHETVYGFNTNDFLRDVIFKKYEIINKDSVTVNDFYIGYWSDDDLGNASDDYIGCDSALFMGYTYNANAIDPYFSDSSSAIGHVVLDGLEKNGMNLMMSAFGPNFKGSAVSHDPADSLQYYNLIRGLLNNGDEFINPFTNLTTAYPLNGDPESDEGWILGNEWPNYNQLGGMPTPGDKRFYLSSGPVDLAPGDTQSVTVALVIALGGDNFNAVTKLKELAEKIHVFYGNDFVLSVNNTLNETPNKFILYQNYPNPFNPTTKIKFSIPAKTHSNISGTAQRVKLSVYDLLGRKVATLVNEEKQPGYYEVEFNASGISSGIYYYRIQAGEFVEVKKMMLLK